MYIGFQYASSAPALHVKKAVAANDCHVPMRMRRASRNIRSPLSRCNAKTGIIHGA